MNKQRRLQLMAEKVAECNYCPHLAESRTQTVFGDGNPESKIVFLGEAPGADEDAQGLPFVGRAGKLLDNILAACGLSRQDIYICNILKCRPPGNRNPNGEEIKKCSPYLKLQLTVLNPDYIVCMGLVASHSLLGPRGVNTKDEPFYEPMRAMRGKWYHYEPTDSKVLCTYHPAYLLRNPNAKKLVWQDLQLLLKEAK
jgi:DNA polymerase